MGLIANWWFVVFTVVDTFSVVGLAHKRDIGYHHEDTGADNVKCWPGAFMAIIFQKMKAHRGSWFKGSSAARGFKRTIDSCVGLALPHGQIQMEALAFLYNVRYRYFQQPFALRLRNNDSAWLILVLQRRGRLGFCHILYSLLKSNFRGKNSRSILQANHFYRFDATFVRKAIYISHIIHCLQKIGLWPINGFGTLRKCDNQPRVAYVRRKTLDF